ncbi:MAG: 30S ribosomal protein S2 [Gammaproteobacteria bacterium]|nr:30S ribosomal protein S2 [Gammaproteobacteria bacterium]NKB62780.1 30S ribosomal protein S2 [Gammaproteobacteria bacterium]
MADITMRQLLQAGVHFGHQTRYWSPSMAPYIFGDRNKIHIINLQETLPMLQEAMNYLGSKAAQGGKVLFVGTKRQAGKIIKEEATRCGASYVDHRWLGGMLTNFKTVKNSIARLKELEQRIDSGATARLSKKEGLTLERERLKLDKTLSGIKDMNGLPDVLFVIDVEQEYIAVAEANKLGIPVIAVVDTNCSVKGIDYIIPGNDDSTRAIKLYMEAAADAILASKTAARAVSAGNSGEEYVEVTDEAAVAESEASAPVAGGEPVVEVEVAAEPVIEEAVVEPAKEVVEDATAKKISKKKVVRKKAAEGG